MKTTTKSHISRDLAILIFTGFIMAITIVTAVILLVNQL